MPFNVGSPALVQPTVDVGQNLANRPVAIHEACFPHPRSFISSRVRQVGLTPKHSAKKLASRGPRQQTGGIQDKNDVRAFPCHIGPRPHGDAYGRLPRAARPIPMPSTARVPTKFCIRQRPVKARGNACNCTPLSVAQSKIQGELAELEGSAYAQDSIEK